MACTPSPGQLSPLGRLAPPLWSPRGSNIITLNAKPLLFLMDKRHLSQSAVPKNVKHDVVLVMLSYGWGKWKNVLFASKWKVQAITSWPLGI